MRVGLNCCFFGRVKLADTLMFLGGAAFVGTVAFGGAVGVEDAGGELNGGIRSRWAFSIADGLLSKKALIWSSCSTVNMGPLGGPADVLFAE